MFKHHVDELELWLITLFDVIYYLMSHSLAKLFLPIGAHTMSLRTKTAAVIFPTPRQATVN